MVPFIGGLRAVGPELTGNGGEDFQRAGRSTAQEDDGHSAGVAGARLPVDLKRRTSRDVLVLGGRGDGVEVGGRVLREGGGREGQNGSSGEAHLVMFVAGDDITGY